MIASPGTATGALLMRRREVLNSAAAAGPGQLAENNMTRARTSAAVIGAGPVIRPRGRAATARSSGQVPRPGSTAPAGWRRRTPRCRAGHAHGVPGQGHQGGGQGKAEHQRHLLPHRPPGQGHAQQEHGQGNAPDQGLGAVAADQRNADFRIRAQAAEGQELPLIHARLLHVDLQAAKAGEVFCSGRSVLDRGSPSRRLPDSAAPTRCRPAAGLAGWGFASRQWCGSSRRRAGCDSRRPKQHFPPHGEAARSDRRCGNSRCAGFRAAGWYAIFIEEPRWQLRGTM